MSDRGAIDDNQQPMTGTMPAQLSMVVLSATDLPVLRGFYRSLGWSEQAGASDTLSMFRLGVVTLALYPATTAAGGTLTENRSAVTLVVNVDTPEAVDEAFAAAIRAGAEPVVDPQDQPWGGRSGIIADPEGNRWELLWVPARSEEG
jgi:predicted lactoylglutathione lyase